MFRNIIIAIVMVISLASSSSAFADEETPRCDAIMIMMTLDGHQVALHLFYTYNVPQGMDKDFVRIAIRREIMTAVQKNNYQFETTGGLLMESAIKQEVRNKVNFQVRGFSLDYK